MQTMYDCVQTGKFKISTVVLIVSVLFLIICGYLLESPPASFSYNTKATTKTTIPANKVAEEEDNVKKKENDIPNIIFAMADDLGWGDVQYNNGNAVTPNLNKMATSTGAILLQRYYSGGPVCSPTRGTVLTGRNHNRYCVWHANVAHNKTDFKVPEKMPLPLSEISVAEVLRKAGYGTALFGKWHLGDFKPIKGGNKKWPVSHPGQHGFEQWIATERSARTFATNCACFENIDCILGHNKAHPECTNYYSVNNHSKEVEAWTNPIQIEDSRFIWSLAETFIKNQVKLKKPFFLYLPFHAVHIPYIATTKYSDKYLNKGYDLNQADYYGTISAMDEVIGRIRTLLEQLGITNNTLLWFSSDNGPARGSPGVTNHLRGRKGSLYEGGIRVPAIIEWPDVIKGNRVSWFPVVSNDLLPTVYDILGVEPVDDRPLDGISILPFLRGEVLHRNHSIFWAFYIPGNFRGHYSVAVSKDHFKLIAKYTDGEVVSYQLYNLMNDTKESKDLKSQHPAVCQKLLLEIVEWRKSVMDSVKKVGCLGYSYKFSGTS